jgi:hypothetical protein
VITFAHVYIWGVISYCTIVTSVAAVMLFVRWRREKGRP